MIPFNFILYPFLSASKLLLPLLFSTLLYSLLYIYIYRSRLQSFSPFLYLLIYTFFILSHTTFGTSLYNDLSLPLSFSIFLSTSYYLSLSNSLSVSPHLSLSLFLKLLRSISHTFSLSPSFYYFCSLSQIFPPDISPYLLSSIHSKAGRAFRFITSWVWASSPVTILPTVRRAEKNIENVAIEVR